MKIVVLDAYTTNPGDLSWGPLQQLGKVDVYERTSTDLIIPRALDADTILTNKVILNAQTLNSLPRLKYIGILATGTNVVDLAHARSLGITVTNIPNYSTESVVQSTFAHLLNLASNLVKNTSKVRDGGWITCRDFSFSMGKITELHGKTIGIVGLGTIGRRVAQVAHAFGMNVLAYSPRLNVGQMIDNSMAVALDDLFIQSDIISLHCPLTETTQQLINDSKLSLMKQGAWLINTGRGQLLDEEAVSTALWTGKLGGAGLDVLSTEPPQKNNPLLKAPNCFITPHNAWASFESRQRLIQIATDNLIAFIEKRSFNVVN